MKTVLELANETGTSVRGSGLNAITWVFREEKLDRFAALVREQYREELLGVGAEPIHHEMHNGVCVSYFSTDQLAAAVLRAKESK